MTVYNVTLQVAQNEDLRQAFELKGRSLAGTTLRMHVRDKAGELVADLTTGNGGIVVTDAAAGIFELRLYDEQLADIVPGSYEQDLLLLDGDATTRIWFGELRVLKGVTL